MLARRPQHATAVLLAFGISAALAACATSGSGSSGPRRSTNRITADELAEVSTLSVFDAIRRLRPQWLQGNRARAVIVHDGTRVGDQSYLSTIAASTVESMRFMSASDATMQYGTGFPNGAIVLTSRSR